MDARQRGRVISPPSVTTLETQDEAALVGRLFDFMRDHPHALATTWGGEARDHAMLRQAAMRHGLELPPQLIDSRVDNGRKLDPCDALTGRAKQVHLGEVATALGIPSKPVAARTIGRHAEQGRWRIVADQALADVLTTVMIAVHWLRAQGHALWDVDAMHRELMRTAIATNPERLLARNRLTLPVARPVDRTVKSVGQPRGHRRRGIMAAVCR